MDEAEGHLGGWRLSGGFLPRAGTAAPTVWFQLRTEVEVRLRGVGGTQEDDVWVWAERSRLVAHRKGRGRGEWSQH